MTENEVIITVRTYIESKFPKTCSNCGNQYDTLEDYLRNTTHVGDPISYDAEQKNWRPDLSMGTLSLANCSCGNTLAIGSAGIKLTTMWKLLLWARKESKRQGISIRVLLAQLRQKIDKQVLGDLNPKN